MVCWGGGGKLMEIEMLFTYIGFDKILNLLIDKKSYILK